MTMVLQEKIKNIAEGFGKLAPVFLEGAKFALENQWISIDDDLPCNHEELIKNENYTKKVLVVLAWNDDPSKKHIEICDMCNRIGSFNQIGIGRIQSIIMSYIGNLYQNYQKNRG